MSRNFGNYGLCYSPRIFKAAAVATLVSISFNGPAALEESFPSLSRMEREAEIVPGESESTLGKEDFKSTFSSSLRFGVASTTALNSFTLLTVHGYGLPHLQQ